MQLAWCIDSLYKYNFGKGRDTLPVSRDENQISKKSTEKDRKQSFHKDKEKFYVSTCT